MKIPDDDGSPLPKMVSLMQQMLALEEQLADLKFNNALLRQKILLTRHDIRIAVKKVQLSPA